MDPTAPAWVALCILGFAEREVPRASLALLALLGWAAVSLLWSPDPMAGVDSLWKMAAFIGVVIARPPLWTVPPLVALVLASSLIWPELIGYMGNENWQAEFFLIALPLVCVAAWGGKIRHTAIALVAIASLLFLVFWNGSYTLWLILGADAILVALWLAWKREYGWAAVLIMACVCGLLWGWERVETSVFYRLELAFNTGIMWLDSPLWGQGLGSFNYLYPFYQERHLAWLSESQLYEPSYVAGAAHNELLELVTVLGLIGFIPVWAFVKSLPRKWTLEQMGAGLALYHAVVLSFVGFPFQVPATGLLIALSLGLLLTGAPAYRFNPYPIVALPCLVMALLAVEGAWHRAVADAHLDKQYAKVVKQDPLIGFVHSLKAVEAYPFHWHYRQQVFLAFRAVLNRYNVNVTPQSADRIFDEAMSAGPVPATLMARIDYLRRAGRGGEEARQLLAQLEAMTPNEPRLTQIRTIVGSFDD